MSITIRPIQLGDAPSFRQCLDAVAKERLYLAQLEALPLDRMQAFVASSVADDAAQFVAVDSAQGGQVVGWCDIFGHWAHAIKHTGSMGMGVLAAHRGQGLGEQLLRATLAKAAAKGITRVTLDVREGNHRAIKLYQRVGFELEAVKRHALLVDGQSFSSLQMVRFQPGSAPA